MGETTDNPFINPPDGAVLENDHGYVVGHCAECRIAQTKLYGFNRSFYCLKCYGLMRAVHVKREETLRWEDINFVLKYAILHGKDMGPDDIYLIEKLTDDCHGELQKYCKRIGG